MHKDSLIALLKRMVKPALGCTEPAAIALAVARANLEIRGELRKVFVRMSGNIFKNARGVGIPGTTESGIDFAVALALVCGKWEMGLEVFSDVDEKAVQEAHALMDKKIIFIEVCDGEGNFFIEANIEADNSAKVGTSGSFGSRFEPDTAMILIISPCGAKFETGVYAT